MPLVGRIAAGGPILAEERVEDVFALPKQLVGEGTLFLLQVTGDSMIDAAIMDGDWVVVRQQPVAENGDIVAAMIDGEATVKTFKRKDGHVWLDAAEPRLRPDPRRRGDAPRPRRGGAAQALSPATGRRPGRIRPPAARSPAAEGTAACGRGGVLPADPDAPRKRVRPASVSRAVGSSRRQGTMLTSLGARTITLRGSPDR